MTRRASRPATFLQASSLALALLASTLVARPARADDTIKHPGDHPHYSVELEPHALLGWGLGYGGGGYGVGGRVSIPIVQNGFVQEINNSVAISFGLDIMFYGGCYYRGDCSATYFDIPVVMQWNFFVARRWSVFGEPGVVLYHGDYGACPAGAGCPAQAPVVNGIEPALYLGGRYHLSEGVSLTMRVGFPAFSFGGSFFL